MVVDVNEPSELVAVALDRPETVDHQLVCGLAPAAVLVVERNGEDLEPDALKVDADDVLPRDGGRCPATRRRTMSCHATNATASSPSLMNASVRR